MRRATKIVLWSFGALLSTMAAAVFFLAVAGDDFYRWAMRQAIEGALNREVRVDGTYSFELGWQPTLIVTDIWIEDAAWTGKKEMGRAKRVEVQVALRPLLSGILHLPRLVVDGLTLDLEKSSDNQENWDIAAADNGSDEAPGLPKLVYPLVDFVALTDIAVTYTDHENGKVTELVLETLSKADHAVGDTSYKIQGAASLNQHPFTITAQVGTVEEAIAALKPFPLDIKLQSEHLLVQLSGTAENIAKGRGLDLGLQARTSSIYAVLQALQIEGEVFGPALASVQLKGDMTSLAAEDIRLEVIAPSGEELNAKGRIANLIRGDGLDIQFAGDLNPKILNLIGDLPPATAALLDGFTNFGAEGQLAGTLKQPALKDLKLQLEHVSGAEIALSASATADLSGDDFTLVDFQATTQAFLPDQDLLAKILGVRIPDLSEINATADVAWAGDTISLRSASVTGKAFRDVQVSGEGKLGSLSGTDFTFVLDVAVDLTGSSASSQPLIYLIEGFSPSMWRLPEASGGGAPGTSTDPAGAGENLILQVQRALVSVGSAPGVPDGKMGPATRTAIEDYQAQQGLSVDGKATEALLGHLKGAAEASADPAVNADPQPVFVFSDPLPDFGSTAGTMRLFFKDGVFRFLDLSLTLGRKGADWANISGDLGALPDGPTGLLKGTDVVVLFGSPSSQNFAQILPPETPEFTKISGRFSATGAETVITIGGGRVVAEGPNGMQVVATGGIGAVDLEGDIPEVRKLGIDFEARWPDTQSVYDFVHQELPSVNLPDMELPELGPVQARASLRNTDGPHAAKDIVATAGPPEQPRIRITGDIADVEAMTGVELTGEFDVATALLFAQQTGPVDKGLGDVHGRFELSDEDGSFGFEILSAEIEDSELLSLSVNGLFDDIKEGDELRFATSLQVPSLMELGRKLNFDAENLGSLTYDGELSGSDEHLTVEGKALIGKTEITGHITGALVGEHPSFKGKIHSPLFRLADVGIVPRDGPEEDSPESVQQEAAEEAAPETKQNAAQDWLFDEEPISFDTLKLADLDLDVVLEDIEGVRLDIDKAEAKISIVKGELKVAPVTFDFVGGSAELDLQVDARGDDPQVSLHIDANDVDLENLLSQAKVEVPLDGTMDFVLDLTAQGNSAREMASSLNGTTQLAIEEGHVLTGLLTLTTTNPISWMFTESARKGYSSMNCLIMRFDIEDGLAKSQTLLLDTPEMQALGKGQIDFRNETLAIDVDPRAKRQRLVSLSTPFSIKGPLADPSINISTTGASLRTGGEVLLSPLNLLGSLLPFVGNGGGDKDNLCLTLKNVPPTE